MAVTQNPLVGRTRNSVGGVTFTTWKGKNVIKAKPVSVANPQTPAQRIQRSKLTLMVLIYRLMASVVAIGYKTRAVGQSSYNAFVSDNIEGGTTGSSSGPATLNPAALHFGRGTMGSVVPTSLTGTNGSPNVVFGFPTDIPLGGTADDTVIPAVYNATQNVWSDNWIGSTRSTGTSTAIMPANCATADVLHGYLFFKSANSDECSDSSYITDAV